ncbi:type II toxin-antitoxin system prevent-host-death family antitoxin [Streptomyces sp. SAS_275]|uniref:type II toxin-antitoxin system prevent-host-death family antitoxin n=1 Tax=Streptomyces sp. SAS_275 TaxID=3412746 RepID=UPI00403CD3E6
MRAPRNKLGAIARQVGAEHRQVAITHRGQIVAVLISPAELEELEGLVAVLFLAA